MNLCRHDSLAHKCQTCDEIREAEEATRVRVLGECMEKVKEILDDLWAARGVYSTTGSRIYALFSPGGPLDPEAKP